MKTYQIKSSATRAAKAQFGENWKEVATIKGDLDSGWWIETEVVKSIEPALQAQVEVIEQLAAIEADTQAKKAKKAEIESRKPAFIPAEPLHIDQAIVEALTPIPSLPAFLIPSPPSDSEVAALQAEADRQANAAAVNVDPLKPRMSTIERPTKKVWAVADSMPGAKRSEVIAECVRQGIAYGTARTQYQHWFKCKADSEAAPIAVIGADGKPYIPTK